MHADTDAASTDPASTEPANTKSRALQRLRAETADRAAGLDAEIQAMIDASANTNADDEHDPEGSTIAFERAQLIALRSDAQVRLAELDSALQRCLTGSYGSCTQCGAMIDVERLAARPATSTCIRCAVGATRR